MNLTETRVQVPPPDVHLLQTILRASASTGCRIFESSAVPVRASSNGEELGTAELLRDVDGDYYVYTRDEGNGRTSFYRVRPHSVTRCDSRLT